MTKVAKWRQNEEPLQSESAQKQRSVPDLNQHENLQKRFIKLGCDVAWETESAHNKQDKNESTLSILNVDVMTRLVLGAKQWDYDGLP